MCRSIALPLHNHVATVGEHERIASRLMEVEGVERIQHDGKLYAEIIWSGTRVSQTTFFSPPSSSFQFGLLAHEAGFEEPPHYHQEFAREITDLQQMFVVQRGVVEVLLFSDEKDLIQTVVLKQGDAIVLVHGIHSIRVLEDMQCISVKQGPFLGPEKDKVIIDLDK